MKMRLIALAACALLAACGGGGGGGTGSLTPPGQTPSPAPTVSPTPGPSPQASQTSVAFQTGSAQSVSVTETGYTGAFTENDTCNPLSGTIALITVQSNANGSATYAIAPIAAGTCTVTVGDSAKHTTMISVSVATAAITIH